MKKLALNLLDSAVRGIMIVVLTILMLFSLAASDVTARTDLPKEVSPASSPGGQPGGSQSPGLPLLLLISGEQERPVMRLSRNLPLLL